MNDLPSTRDGIALIGYRGTGKSTVGRILAERLGFLFHDADEVLERRYGSIRSIFETHGEPTFRDYEEQVLLDLTRGGPAVLSTGGGAILREPNRRNIRRFGRVFWLTADPVELANRLQLDPKGASDRPSLTSAGTLDEIATVLETRIPLYQETADQAISTQGLTPGEVAESILEILSKPSDDALRSG